MNKKICICTLAALALMSCSSSGDDEQQVAPPAKRPLIVVVNENPFVDENGNALAPMRQGTRGPAITTESLTDFKMYSSGIFYILNKNNGKWKSNPGWWPVDNYDQEITFYAYNVGHDESDNSKRFYPGDQTPPEPYISFEVPENASTQTDLLVAKTTTSYNAHQGQVSLTFDHACAAVNFTVAISPKLYAKLGNSNLTVKSIILENVIKEGDFFFSNGWTLENATDKNTTSYTLTTAETTSVGTGEQPLLNGTNLFLIPQTLGSGAQFTITYKLAGDSESKTTSISLAGETWQAGYQYTMSIYLGTSNIPLNKQ